MSETIAHVLIRIGSGGTPRSLAGHLRMIHGSVRTGEQWSLPALDIPHALRSKLRTCSQRAAQRDFTDLAFILETFPTEVQGARPMLDLEEVDVFLDLVPSEDRAVYAAQLGPA